MDIKKIILFLLIPTVVFAAPPSRTKTYTAGDIIRSADVTENEDNIFNYLSAGVDTYADETIVNADIKTTANIQSEKLNLGSIAQNVTITSSGSFSNAGTSTFTGNSTFSGTTIADLGTVTTGDIDGGTIDGTTIGASTAAAGTFSALTASSTFNLGTTNQGDILYDNGTSIVRLTPGTNRQFLQTQGAADNPIWANDNNTGSIVFMYVASTDQQGTREGECSGETDLSPASCTGGYRYFVTDNTTSTTVISQQFRKSPFINTLVIYAELWNDGATTNTLTVDVNSGTSVDITSTQVGTPAWSNSTLDVSGLSDGTVYTLDIKLKNSNPGSPSFLGNMVIFGS